MKIDFSCLPKEEDVYTTVTLIEEREDYRGSVEIGCWVPNSDSNQERAHSTRQEAIRLLRLALEALESS